ncbi:MAG: glycosyl hydrolase family 17 protein [Bacteroidota bacterium]|nr:glycosyl hydrolase family 17 protein [Bacteroidota bacterium]MEC8238747.1 glycosyl hydrolase family 17 protein [Bacteroidota bacterium]
MTGVSLLCTTCSPLPQDPTAADILGNPNFQAISYGGYRAISRDTVPSVDQIKDDLRILSAIDVKILRTYNTELAELPNLLKAISELKQKDSSFEMYVMVGAWINCKDAWTDHPDHTQEDEAYNEAEVQRAVQYAKQYPDIIKMIAIGNEATVHWATSYFVPPSVILKWVNYLQELKSKGDLPSDLWITSSDDFAAWGGASDNYHTEDLNRLIAAVDFISMHTYPFHNSHYSPDYWYIRDPSLSKIEQIDASMQRAGEFAIGQYNDVRQYILSLGIDKPIHIGETGWATTSNGFYGAEGSQAADEYKAKKYYDYMRKWSNENGVSCFYFEAFDEPWKDAENPMGSENHFGLFTVDGKAKYSLWSSVDKGIFSGLIRNGNTIEKTFNGNENKLLASILPPIAPKKDINK